MHADAAAARVRFAPVSYTHLLSTDYAITNHLFIGFEDGTFRPNGQMSRAMFAMVLWRVAGSPASSAALPFADVAADAWYADAVRWAYAAGVINGVSTTAFDPESPVTREQMVTMIVRYAEKMCIRDRCGLHADRQRCPPLCGQL